MAASAGPKGDRDLLSAGNHIIVTGIALQVANLVIFASMAVEYGLRLYRHRAELGTKLDYVKDTKFRAFLAAITVAFFGVLIRSTYRIPVSRC